jgi:hypothetical protein
MTIDLCFINELHYNYWFKLVNEILLVCDVFTMWLLFVTNKLLVKKMFSCGILTCFKIIYLCVCVCVCVFVSLCVCVSMCVYISLIFCLSLCPPRHPPVCVHVSMGTYKGEMITFRSWDGVWGKSRNSTQITDLYCEHFIHWAMLTNQHSSLTYLLFKE